MVTHLPMDRGTRRTWLKAGDVEQDGWQPTATGAPQGGIISPALCHLT
jgi:RNA-directed DNA polymerase